VRTLLRLQREMTNGRHHEKNTDAGVRGGAARISVEALVMRVERRGGVIRLTHLTTCAAGRSEMASTKPYRIAKRTVWEAYNW